jgi:signal recognition particle subunit SRP54
VARFAALRTMLRCTDAARSLFRRHHALVVSPCVRVSSSLCPATAIRHNSQNVVKAVNIKEMAAGLNAKNVIERAVFSELVRLVDGSGGAKPWAPKKGAPSVVLFVGLQGAGKTTTATKYAYAYARKGFKPALVCADTFRAGAFDQLKQNATKAKVPFYGSYTETDPARIAADGVELFRKQGCDLIIVDTSGRHKQEASLFEEMQAVSAAVDPQLTVFVMDASVGQAVGDQAAAFRSAVDVGAVIVTKTDGHAKGGGALAAVAATRAPIIFLGTGEHTDEFEPFEPRSFVSRLLGRGDWSGFMDKISDVIPAASQPELMDKLASGQFSMRILYEQFQHISALGPMSAVMSMIPGMADVVPKGQEAAGAARIKRLMCLMDSMTAAELDTTDVKLLSTPSRLERIARGAGRPVQEAVELLEEYKRMAKMMGGLKGMKMPKKGGISPLSQNLNMAQMQRAIPPALLKQMGGPNALAQMMRQLDGKDLSSMMGGMGM